MPDQGEFEPLARQWKPAFEDYQDNAASDAIADEALRVVAAMLRCCGGCPILPRLHDMLWEYQGGVVSHTIWTPSSHEVDYLLNEKLDLLAQNVGDQRVEMVAIRSARKVALQLKEQMVTPRRPSELKSHLATQIIKDLIGHCFLDAARASAVGGRFLTGEEAHDFYDEVMGHIDLGARQMGYRLAINPTGKRLQRYRVLPVKHTTSSIIYSDDFRF